MSKKKKLTRRELRSLAVNCAFSYDFIKNQAIEEEESEKKQTIQVAPPSETVIVVKKVKGGRRKIEMSREEYEANLKTLEELTGDDKPTKSEIKVEQQLKEMGLKEDAPEEFSVDSFIEDVCDSTEALEGVYDSAETFFETAEYNDYLKPVVAGIIEKIDEIDKLISENSIGWRIERLKKTDLAILRVAIFEIAYFSDKVPMEVAANEAVEMAKVDDIASGKFVNGVIKGVINSLKK